LSDNRPSLDGTIKPNLERENQNMAIENGRGSAINRALDGSTYPVKS